MRSYLEINLNKLKSNVDEINKSIKKPIIAVVKSNAYGHGLIPITKCLIEKGIKSFCVATSAEALTLRHYFKDISIILFEPSFNFKTLFENRITLSICSLQYLKKIISTKLSFNIHIKIDTGLNRLGIKKEDLAECIELIKKSRLVLRGVYTHLSGPNNYQNQKELFKSILPYFKDFSNLQIHINSSSYLFDDSFSTHYRIGLALYGLLDLPHIFLQPILSLKSPIYRISKVKKNEYVGYHNKGIIEENGYLYTIPLGYADGWLKERKTLGYNNNNYFKQVGETCMDLLMLFSKEFIPENEIIEIIGEHINIIDLSSFYKESIYQIVSNLSSRLERKYIL